MENAGAAERDRGRDRERGRAAASSGYVLAQLSGTRLAATYWNAAGMDEEAEGEERKRERERVIKPAGAFGGDCRVDSHRTPSW